MPNSRLYIWAWHWANRVRRLLGRPVQPKRCCRNERNLGPIVRETPELVYRRCTVCACRHFVLTADPGRFGLIGQPLTGPR